jgi:hypothetical protein
LQRVFEFKRKICPANEIRVPHDIGVVRAKEGAEMR